MFREAKPQRKGRSPSRGREHSPEIVDEFDGTRPTGGQPAVAAAERVVAHVLNREPIPAALLADLAGAVLADPLVQGAHALRDATSAAERKRLGIELAAAVLGRVQAHCDEDEEGTG